MKNPMDAVEHRNKCLRWLLFTYVIIGYSARLQDDIEWIDKIIGEEYGY